MLIIYSLKQGKPKWATDQLQRLSLNNCTNVRQVRMIVAESTRVAEQFLNADAVDCYYMQLLSSIHALMTDRTGLPHDAELPDWMT